MRIANVSGRLVMVRGGSTLDVAAASEGQFSSDPQAIYDRWEEFGQWAREVDWEHATTLLVDELGSPIPQPRQVFAVGLNYRDHADESGLVVPVANPPIFTKFPSCIIGPVGQISIPPNGHTDWEVELVVVIGRTAVRVSRTDAWSYVAGLTVGQDISERLLQMASDPPQFSMGKSYPGFGPIGPWVVTPDEFADPNDLELGCLINGESVQKARTSDLIFPIADLIESLSSVVTLYPGDAIFTGTPAGVGLGRTPQRWLASGDKLVTYVEGIGEMNHTIVLGEP